MPSIRVATEFNQEMYFVTLVVKDWHYIFDRHGRWDILIQSLKHYQEFKDLKIYAYIFMLNHIHLIIQSSDAFGFLRDFKKHTSFELMKNIKTTEPHIAKLFKTKIDHYSIWQKTNMPKLIDSDDFFCQKKGYIEENPVVREYVAEPQHWIYSSAFEPNLLKLEFA